MIEQRGLVECFEYFTDGESHPRWMIPLCYDGTGLVVLKFQKKYSTAMPLCRNYDPKMHPLVDGEKK